MGPVYDLQLGTRDSGLLNVALRQAALFEIALVIFLGAIKSARRRYFCNDWFLEPASSLLLRLRSARGRFLFGGIEENHRAVLGAFIRSLTVERSGIVRSPKNFQ